MDAIFVLNFNMNVAGAALATSLANTASMLYLLCSMTGRRNTGQLKLTLLPRRIDRQSALALLSIGTPAALQILLSSVSNSVMLRLAKLHKGKRTVPVPLQKNMRLKKALGISASLQALKWIVEMRLKRRSQTQTLQSNSDTDIIFDRRC